MRFLSALLAAAGLAGGALVAPVVQAAEITNPGATPITCATHRFINAFGFAAGFTCTQPTATDVGLGGAETNLTAAGTDQASALGLDATKRYHFIATVPVGSGVRLEACITPTFDVVFNGSSVAVQVYPNGSDTINGQSAGVALTLPGLGTLQLSCSGSGQWAAATISLAVQTPLTLSYVNGVPTLGTAQENRPSISWVPGINPNGIPMITVDAAAVIQSIICRPEAATGSAATINIYKAPSGTALSSGTLVTSTSCDANGSAGVNQTLGLGATNLAAGDTLGLVTTGTTAWTLGTGAGVITVGLK